MACVPYDDSSAATCRSLQKEEYDVLESIYPGYASIEVFNDGTSRLLMEIPVEFTEPRPIVLIEDDTLATPTHTSADLSSIKLNLSSLPPLIIDMILGPSYPLYDPPHLTSIRPTNFWLPQISRLNSVLLEMWRPGEGILYNWIEFIRTGDFLQSLAMVSHIDNYTTITHPSPPILASLLEAYDASTKTTQFLQNTYLCSICLTSLKGTKCIKLLCDHIFCRSCLVDFWGLCIAEGEIGRVGCPDPECVKAGREANIEDVVRVMTQAEVQRWGWLREKRDLEKDPSIIHCPMIFCQNPVSKPSGTQDDSGWDRLRSCLVCSFSFCAFCRRSWHGPHTACPIAHSEKLVLKYLSFPENSTERQAIERRFGKSNIVRLLATYEEERANEQWLQSSTMGCPGCQVHVEKSLGCNHMTCAKCQQHFCYRCGTKLAASNPYAHFSTPGHRCYNKLFDFQSEDEEWQPMEGFA